MEEVKIEDRKWCVYMHINKINNKMYIGITSRNPEERWGKNGVQYNKKTQSLFANAIQKYGWDGFEHVIFAENLSQEEAKHIEMLLIALYKTNSCRYRDPEYGYNMTDGGDGTLGHINSEETRSKISTKAKERYADPKNHPMYGKHIPSERNPFYGKCHTEETKIKLKEHAIKRFQNIINHPSYGRGKAVIQFNLDGVKINEFISATDAEKHTSINSTSIRRCCCGKYKTAGNYKWMYKEEWEEMQGAI